MKSCLDCPHVVTVESRNTTRPIVRYICGHYDCSDLDSNEAGRPVGLSPVMPDWCPLGQKTITAFPDREYDTERAKKDPPQQRQLELL